jgi:SNF family Na+-dependent transporter
MNLVKLNKILEKFWWTMAVITLLGVTYMAITEGMDKWSFYFLVPFFCVLMALMRRMMAKKMDRSTPPKNK